MPTLRIDHTAPSAWSAKRAFESWPRRYSAALRHSHDLTTERARVRLQRNPAKSLRLSALARESATSTSVIHRRFVSELGETPLRYRTRLRVVKAIPLLQQGVKVDAVAAVVGWKTRKDLYRAVRERDRARPADIRVLTALEADVLAARVSVDRVIPIAH